MIRKLRIKFICINMLLVVLLLGLLLGLLSYYVQRNIVKNQIILLRRAAETPGAGERPGAAGEEQLLYFTLEYRPDGALSGYDNGNFGFSDEEKRELYERGCAAEKQIGVLEDVGLRYYRIHTPRGPKLVFADMSGERAMILHIKQLIALIGVGSFAVLFVVSLLLSGWVVRPVDEAWRQQKQFVADISHELKTPLTVIMSDAELLQQAGYDEAQRKQFSESILVMSRQMRKLVEGMLDLARLDSARHTAPLEQLDFSALVEDCLLPFEPLFFERGLRLEAEIEPGLRVNGNERTLRQCVDILLDNAQKYSEPGRVRVALKRTGHSCELAVSNPAPEMSRAECRDVFTRFYRRDEARTDTGSYGLGLPIAQGIIERHGGKIACDWEAGEICFVITLPLAKNYEN